MSEEKKEMETSSDGIIVHARRRTYNWLRARCEKTILINTLIKLKIL